MPATIPPEMPQAGLFGAARMVAPNGDDMLDWGTGWYLRSACPTGGLWERCQTALPTPEKKDPCPPTTLRFNPFTVYEVAGCGAGAPDLDSEIAANSWLRNNTEGWVAAALEQGIGGIGLKDLTDVSGPTPLGIGQTISLLMRNRAQLGIFDKPTIHLPSWAAPEFGGNWYGAQPKGLVNIAFGPGYGLPGAPAAPAGTAWAYITGTVEISVRELPNIFGVSLEQKRQNLTRFQPERAAIYRFDPCGGFRALVKLCC